MKLPKFKYHPNPLATQSIEKSDSTCICCKKRRKFIYIGPIYSNLDLKNKLCPWCIADGSAHEKFNAEFIDPQAIGNYGLWDHVPQRVINKVAFYTPGFISWQEARWWTHCGDAAEFLGYAGKKEAVSLGKEYLETIRSDIGFKNEDDWSNYLNMLKLDQSPTAYIFRCLQCGQYGGYSDFH